MIHEEMLFSDSSIRNSGCVVYELWYSYPLIRRRMYMKILIWLNQHLVNYASLLFFISRICSFETPGKSQLRSTMNSIRSPQSRNLGKSVIGLTSNWVTKLKQPFKKCWTPFAEPHLANSSMASRGQSHSLPIPTLPLIWSLASAASCPIPDGSMTPNSIVSVLNSDPTTFLKFSSFIAIQIQFCSSFTGFLEDLLTSMIWDALFLCWTGLWRRRFLVPLIILGFWWLKRVEIKKRWSGWWSTWKKLMKRV